MISITFNNLTREQALHLIRVCDNIQQPKPSTEIGQPAKESKHGGNGEPFTDVEKEIIGSAKTPKDAWLKIQERFPDTTRTRATISTQLYRLKKKSKQELSQVPAPEPKPDPQVEDSTTHELENLVPPLKPGSRIMVLPVTGRQPGGVIRSYRPGVIERLGGGADSLIRFPSGKLEWIPKTALRTAV